MEQTVKERIVLYLKIKGIGQNKFERIAGLSNGYISNLKNSPSVDKAEKIFNAAPALNRDWLLTGEGPMEIEETVVNGIYEGAESDTPNSRNLSPCFDLATIQGGAGHGTGLEQMRIEDAIGEMMLPGLPTGVDIPYIQVRGNSMVNRRDPEHSIPEGAWIGLKASNSSVVRWGEVYAIMTTDGPIVKKLQPSEIEGCVKCVSFNEEDGYLPFDLPVVEIIQPLYNIIGVATAKRWK